MEPVAFVSSMQPKGGTWDELVSVPATMGFVQAAALPVAGNTVLRALQALGPAQVRCSSRAGQERSAPWPSRPSTDA